MALILAIDDAVFTRRTIRKLLVEEGHEILEATNGEEGLEMANFHQPHCILVDLLMPVMDGFAVLTGIRERNLNIPVIVITADIQKKVKKRCLELGASGFLNKPPKQAELHQQIDRVLGCHQKRILI